MYCGSLQLGALWPEPFKAQGTQVLWPWAMAVEVAMAGMILPAIIFAFSLSTTGMP